MQLTDDFDSASKKVALVAIDGECTGTRSPRKEGRRQKSECDECQHGLGFYCERECSATESGSYADVPY